MTSEANRSPELDEARQLLFPRLSEDQGWALVDRAFQGAADTRKQEAIEALARRQAQPPPR